MRSAFRKRWERYLLAVGLVLLSTPGILLARDYLTIANLMLIYLLIVLVSAMYLGIGPSFLVIVISFLSMNFFFVQPYFTFQISDPRELLDLFVFLAVAIMTGQLAQYARHQTEEARQRIAEQDTLYQYSSMLNQLSDRQSVLNALRQLVQENLGARQVEVLPVTSAVQSDGGYELYLLLQADSEIFGTVHASFPTIPSPSLSRLIAACVGQTALALYRVQLSERLQKTRVLEEADRLKTALLRSVSHDLRTPITIIKTSASNLSKLGDILSSAELTDIYRTIEGEADQLNRMVGNLLDFSRLQAGAMPINSTWNSPEEVAGDVAARMFQLTGQERVALDFAEPTPLIQFDYGLLLQALTNLVENGLRYEPQGTKLIIRGVQMGPTYRFYIVNHGPDIPESERENLMKPFYSGIGGKTGLGLSIARGIVEAHKGQLWIEDTAGGGATFVIALPAMPVREAF